jgi:tellurite resistance protein TehA-like permease
MCTAISTACLIAPTATHRLRFHKRDRKYVIEVAHRLTIVGLAFLALAILLAVALITDYLFDGAARWIWPALIAVVIVFLWFLRPALRTGSSGP